MQELILKDKELINELFILTNNYNTFDITKNFDEELPIDFIGYRCIIGIFNKLMSDTDDSVEERDIRLFWELDYKKNVFILKLVCTHTDIKYNNAKENAGEHDTGDQDLTKFKNIELRYDFNASSRTENIDKNDVLNEFDIYLEDFEKFKLILDKYFT